MRFCYYFFATLLFIEPAHATMPELTDTPAKPASLKDCRAWANKQNSDAIEMWSMQDDGVLSHELALDRLTLSCLGEDPPDIVGAFSSAGTRDAYCEKHLGTKICAIDSKEEVAAPTEFTSEKSVGRDGSTLTFTSKTDSVEVQSMKVNRGNCQIAPITPQQLKFGQAMSVITWGCNPIEVEMTTNHGIQTFTWER